MIAVPTVKKYEMTVQRIGGVEVRTFPALPKDFDPLNASSAQLKRLGFPPRPENERGSDAAAAKWVKAFGRHQAFTYVAPEFKVLPNRHAPNRRLEAGSEVNANAVSNNWSGALMFSSNFKQIIGSWSVPNVYSPTPIDGGTHYCAVWLGIDGDGSGDALQAGTESDSDASCFPWFEWFPALMVQVSNLLVKPGDVVSLSLWATRTTTSSMFMWNVTSQEMTRFSVTAPQGTALVGNCAEAIVERPSILGPANKSQLTQLARFGEVFFDDVVAFRPLGRNICNPPGVVPRTHYPINLGQLLDMTADDRTTIISTSSFQGSGDILSCSYTGP
jgi:hypothetical protein